MQIMRPIGYAIIISLAQLSGTLAADEPANCTTDVSTISFESMDLRRCQALCRDEKRSWARLQCRDRPASCVADCFAGIKNCHQGAAFFDKSKCNPSIPPPPGIGTCDLTTSAEAWTDDPRLKIEPSNPRSDIRTAKDILNDMIKGTRADGRYPKELFGPSGSADAQTRNKKDANTQFSNANKTFDLLIKNLAGQSDKNCWQCYIDQKWSVLNRVALYMSHSSGVGSGDRDVLKQTVGGSVQVDLQKVLFSGTKGIEQLPNCIIDEFRRLLCRGTDSAVDPDISLNAKYKKYAVQMQELVNQTLALYEFENGEGDCSRRGVAASRESARCVHERIRGGAICENDANRNVFYLDVQENNPLSIRPPGFWCEGYTSTTPITCQ